MVFSMFCTMVIYHLKSAKKFGDILVVSLTSDNFVNKDQTDHSTMKYLE